MMINALGTSFLHLISFYMFIALFLLLKMEHVQYKVHNIIFLLPKHLPFHRIPIPLQFQEKHNLMFHKMFFFFNYIKMFFTFYLYR